MLREPLLLIPDERLLTTYEYHNDASTADDDCDIDELDQSINKLHDVNFASIHVRFTQEQLHGASSFFSKKTIILIKYPNLMRLLGACIGMIIPLAHTMMGKAAASMNSPLSTHHYVFLNLLFSAITSVLAISLLRFILILIIKGFFEMKEEEKNRKLEQIQQKLHEQQLLYVNHHPDDAEDDVDDTNELDRIVSEQECKFIVGTLIGTSISWTIQSSNGYLQLATMMLPQTRSLLLATMPELRSIVVIVTIALLLNIYLKSRCHSQNDDQKSHEAKTRPFFLRI